MAFFGCKIHFGDCLLAKYETINSEITNHVCTITLNRAQVHNAFNPVMISELTSEFLYQSNNPLTRVIILTGEGKSFSAGADLSLSIYQRTLYQDYSTHVEKNSSEVINNIIVKT